jgi:hypothetical protein
MAKTRGSDRLARGKTIAPRELEKIVAIARSKGVKVVDWHVLGQPAPDAVLGTLQVSVSKANTLLQQIMKLKNLRPVVEIFPHGTPNPNVFNFKVRF